MASTTQMTISVTSAASQRDFPALDMQRREAFHERIAHDGQHGGYEYVYDDRTEIPDQKEDGRSYGRAAMNFRKVWGVVFILRKRG